MSARLPFTRVDVVTRALSQANSDTWYELGRGGMDPYATRPAVFDKAAQRWECDCSGFARWCEGLSRFSDGVWFSTTQMVGDGKTPGGEYDLATESRIGNLLAFPALAGVRRYGHVGVVVEVRGRAPWRVAHCASSNPKGRAIQVTDPGIFTRNGAIEIVHRLLLRPESDEG